MNSEEIYIEDESFFFDSYALFEIYSGSEAYKKYKNKICVTSKLNLYEIYLIILRNGDRVGAEKVLANYYQFASDFNENVIKDAAEMKIKMSKRDVSMTDCIGYALARQLGIKFLTGDKEFESLDNVEFVK